MEKRELNRVGSMAL